MYEGVTGHGSTIIIQVGTYKANITGHIVVMDGKFVSYRKHGIGEIED